jgi:phospholipase/carboxylesterase
LVQRCFHLHNSPWRIGVLRGGAYWPISQHKQQWSQTMSDYQFREGQPSSDQAPVFFVFHGTGGDENQFFDFAGQLLPGAHIIAPRGDVSEGGALRYFKRTGEGVYDMADLALRTDKMAAFIASRKTPGRKVVGLGYSNGANILASVQFKAPNLFDATILMHPLIPFAPAPSDFSGRQVLITAGQRDPMASMATTQGLHDYFVQNGAEASLAWHSGGHELRQEELLAAQKFLLPFRA